jgi:hypothetical protein
MTGNPGLNDPELDKEIHEYAEKKRRQQSIAALGAGAGMFVFGLIQWLTEATQHSIMIGLLVFLVICSLSDWIADQIKKFRSKSR